MSLITKLSLLVCFFVTNISLAIDNCSFSYLPNKSHDTSAESLREFKELIRNELNVELKLVSNSQKPKLTNKFFLVNEQEYRKWGVRHLKSSLLNKFSDRFEKILDKESETKFNKLYEKFLKLSDTYYEPAYHQDIGNYFIIKPTHDDRGSSLNRFAGWVKKTTDTDLLVSAKEIFESGSDALYQNRAIFMNLREAIWGNFTETGWTLHEYGHSALDQKRDNEIASLFHTDIEYLEEQKDFVYSDFLSFEEVYTMIFNIERQLYNLKFESLSHGEYLRVSTPESIMSDLYEVNDVFSENLKLVNSYTKKLKEMLRNGFKEVEIVGYQFYVSSKKGFSIDLKIKNDNKTYHYDVVTEEKINLSKVTKTDTILHAFFRKQLVQVIDKQLNLFKKIQKKYAPLSKRISALGDNEILTAKEIADFHVVARELRKLVRDK